MTSARLKLAFALCGATALAVPVIAQPQTNPIETPVVLPPALKAALLKRITIENSMEGTPAELLQKLAMEHKFKIAIDSDPNIVRQAVVGKEKTSISPQKNARLDMVIHEMLMRNGGVVYCVARKDTLVLVDPSQAYIKLPGNRVGIQTILQPPDATHLAISNAVKKKLASKVDVIAGDKPMAEFLAQLTQKHELKFEIHGDEFGRQGNPNVGDAKVTTKAGKGVALETVLRDTLKTAGAKATLNLYTGALEIKPIAEGR